MDFNENEPMSHLLGRLSSIVGQYMNIIISIAILIIIV